MLFRSALSALHTLGEIVAPVMASTSLAVPLPLPFLTSLTLGCTESFLNCFTRSWTAWSWLPLPGEPPLTRFVVEQLATPHWYDMSPARRDFGYQPTVHAIEGLALLTKALRERPV